MTRPAAEFPPPDLVRLPGPPTNPAATRERAARVSPSPAAYSAARLEKAARLARDPVRIESAMLAAAGFEALLLDATALESVGPGEIRGGMQPAALSHRRMALAALETVIVLPENAGAIRERSLRVLASLLQQPWPHVVTPEADQFVLDERAHALSLLVKSDPAAAAEALANISESRARQRIATRALHRLVQGGMGRDAARAKLAALSMKRRASADSR